MNSVDLKKNHFEKWHKFKLNKRSEILRILPKSQGVYAIRHKKSFGRFNGKSDLLYIGSSIEIYWGLRGRIGYFFKPGVTQWTSKRIYELLKKTNELEISFVEISGEKARQLEKKILREYEMYHGELPPLNRSA